jgi:hypothetical protein
MRAAAMTTIHIVMRVLYRESLREEKANLEAVDLTLPIGPPPMLRP